MSAPNFKNQENEGKKANDDDCGRSPFHAVESKRIREAMIPRDAKLRNEPNFKIRRKRWNRRNFGGETMGGEEVRWRNEAYETGFVPRDQSSRAREGGCLADLDLGHPSNSVRSSRF